MTICVNWQTPPLPEKSACLAPTCSLPPALRNIGISIIARQEVPHDPQLRVLTIENAPQIAEYLYCLKERKSARLPAAFLGLAQEMSPL